MSGRSGRSSRSNSPSRNHSRSCSLVIVVVVVVVIVVEQVGSCASVQPNWGSFVRSLKKNPPYMFYIGSCFLPSFPYLPK